MRRGTRVTIKIKQAEQKEIARIKFTDTRELVAPLVDKTRSQTSGCGWRAIAIKDGRSKASHSVFSRASGKSLRNSLIK